MLWLSSPGGTASVPSAAATERGPPIKASQHFTAGAVKGRNPTPSAWRTPIGLQRFALPNAWPRWGAKLPGRGGHEAQGHAESDARADPRIRPGRRREVFRPSRTGRRRGKSPVRRLSVRPGAGGAAPPRVPRPCTCGGCRGRQPNAPHAEDRRTKDSRPPPDVHLRRGAKTRPGGTPRTGVRLPRHPTRLHHTEHGKESLQPLHTLWRRRIII